MQREEYNKVISKYSEKSNVSHYMQLQDNAKWSIESQAVTGFGDMNSYYSSGSQMLYVMNSDMDSVADAKVKMEEVLGEEGEI